MSLKSQNFLPYYNSTTNNIIESFYVPALSNCKEYKRVSAYFDSNILNLYSIGIENIILSKGHISFIFSSELSETDFEKMKQGYLERERIEANLLKGIDTEDVSIELSNLAYLIANGVVDIKIAFTKRGIFHDKFGLIIDGDDTLYFRGSNNETVAAIQNNYESFETSCSWNSNDAELSKIENAINEFDKLWNDKCPGTVVIDIPDVVKDKLLTFDKGKIIYGYSSKENAFIFDLDDNDTMVGINNLAIKDYMLPSTLWYKGYVQSYVENQPSSEDNYYVFDKNLSYLGMRKIIDLVTSRSVDKGFDVYVSPRLRKYLLDNDIKAEKRRSLGIAIKNRSPLIKEAFDEFSSIVNNRLERELREPQMWDAFHIAKMKRSANFSVPGAGKTSIVYGAFAYLLDKGEVNKIVMIGPINSFLSWKKEFNLNFGNKLKPKIFDYQTKHYHSAQERFDGLITDTVGCNLVLINYEAVNNNIDALKQIIDSKTLLVFDEVHRIKSINGVRSQSCLEVSLKANYKTVLSGTPIPNGYVDIYMFLHLLFPNEYDILFNYDEPTLTSANRDEILAGEINNSIYPFYCRTTKKDLHVPPPEKDDLETGYCLFGDRFEKLLSIVYKNCSYSTLLLYIRLMQASTNPGLLLKRIDEDDLHSLDSEENGNDFSDIFTVSEKDLYTPEEKSFVSSFDMTEKFYKGIELAKELSNRGEQCIIWEVFVNTIMKTKSHLDAIGVSSRVIYGSTPSYEREQIIESFIRKEFDVLITNPHTLAESVSLHKNCHHAIYMEYSFNLVHMLQSRDRIHRLGLRDDEKTYYHYMMMDNPSYLYNTIDLKIYNRLKEKELIQSEAVEGTEIVYLEEDLKKDIEDLLKE